MTKRLLMVAYHFPPLAGSSGVQRTLRFAKYLGEYGWEPLVLTAHPRSYDRVGSDQLEDIPPGIVIRRAFALDTSRHLAVARRYPASLARPDRWISWALGAVPAGLAMIRKYAPAAIWSTYPIATAHVIGAALHRFTGIPWIADFRDPMAQEGYPADPKTWQSFARIERSAVTRAAFTVFTTPGAARVYRERYPSVASERITVIENGYDEESFEGLTVPRVDGPVHRPVLLLHSGTVYPHERDPTHFFSALRQLKQAGRLTSADLRVRLRAAAHDSYLAGLLSKFQVEDMVELAPPLTYRDALFEMITVDALLIMQGNDCNEQVPAKLYEYLRAGKPILGLTDPNGDTAGVMRDAGLNDIANLHSADDIVAKLPAFVDAVRGKSALQPNPAYVQGASRKARTQELARLLDAACGQEMTDSGR